jgi:WD40 repeat protein
MRFVRAILVLVAAAAAAAVPSSPVWSLQFSPDGKTLAAGAHREVRLWNVETRTPLRTLSGPAGPVRCLAWSGDGRQLAAGGGLPAESGEVLVWQSPADTPGAPVTMKEHRDVVESVAFSARGDALLSAGLDEKALAVSLSTRKVLAAMQDHTSRVVAVALAPNGRWVATASLDRTIKLWSAEDYKPVANIDAGLGPVHGLAFLPGDQIAAAGEEGNVRVFRLQESTIPGNRTPILAIAGAARGGLLVYGGADRTVHVIDANTGNRRHVLRECPDAVYAVAVNPEGTLIAAGCRDGKVRLWSASDGKLAAEW